MKQFILALSSSFLIANCSNYVEVQTRPNYVQPTWYTKCKNIDTESEGWKFWQSKKYFYSCGSGKSGFESAASAKALQLAKRNLADRINGYISSTTTTILKDEGDAETLNSFTSSEMTIVNKIDSTRLEHYAETDKYSYKFGNDFYAFVMIKISKENAEAARHESSISLNSNSK